MRRVNYVFMLLVLLSSSYTLYSQCSGFVAPPVMNPCSVATSSLGNNLNINSGSYSYCGTSAQSASFSGIALNGGSIYICGNATLNLSSNNSGAIYVACGANLTIPGNLTVNQNLNIVNRGTITVNGTLTFQNGGINFYNVGVASKITVNGDWTFPGNAVQSLLSNEGKIRVTGTLNIGGGGRICGKPGSVISTNNFKYGSNNCNPSDINNNRLTFDGNSSQRAILQYSGTAQLAGSVTSSSSWHIYRQLAPYSLVCVSRPSSWGSATTYATSVPALPAESSQSSCLINGNVVCTQAVALPVELTHFNANCVENKVQLQWSTASERNNQYWTIERSTDLVSTEVIGHVDGAGNSSQLVEYFFEDVNALGQTAYYRITQYDYDGEHKSFEWISIDCGLSAEFNVFPNPSSNVFKVTTSRSLEDKTTYQVVDFNGKVILDGNAELNPGKPAELDLEGFNPGVYYLRIHSGSASWTTKLVKL